MKNGFTVVQFFLCAILLTMSSPAHTQSSVLLNQVGYKPGAGKYAAVADAGTTTDFTVVKGGTKEVVLKGTLSEPVTSVFSGITTRLADLSVLHDKGVYELVYGNERSHPFTIAGNVFTNVSKAAIKSFYYQRVSVPLAPVHAGKWSRAAGHPDDAVLVHASAANASRPEGTVISSPGGWYDAGDYNKYIVNSGITTGTLLAAYENFSAYYDTLYLNIPESGNGIPDLLNEVLCNLRWMLTMQDPADGGVYHKCTNAKFDGKVMPGVTKDIRYVVQKSTAATLDFTAVMAQASRVYAKFRDKLPGLADSCLQAAKAAWQWSLNNPSVLYNQEEMNRRYAPPVSTGAYGDRNVKDEWFWAAVELSVTTGGATYLEAEPVNVNVSMSVPSWNSVAMMGVYTALTHRSVFEGAGLNTGKLMQEMLEYADGLIRGGNKAFKTVMGQSARDFVWGSNAVAMNQGMLLVKAFLLTKDRKYLDGAASNLDYVLGRNATGYSFVTGYGSRTPMHIHHRPSEADGIAEPIPGFLAGGPNPGQQDKCNYAFSDPERSYVDDYCSYASNEIAINWNAPLVYVVGAVDFLE